MIVLRHDEKGYNKSLVASLPLVAVWCAILEVRGQGGCLGKLSDFTIAEYIDVRV
jgi:hypothetical protein